MGLVDFFVLVVSMCFLSGPFPVAPGAPLMAPQVQPFASLRLFAIPICYACLHTDIIAGRK